MAKKKNGCLCSILLVLFVISFVLGVLLNRGLWLCLLGAICGIVAVVMMTRNNNEEDEVEDIEDEEDRLGEYVCMDKKGVIHTTLDCGNIDTDAMPIPTEGLTHEVLAEYMMANYVFGEPTYCPECFPYEWQRELEERMEVNKTQE